MYEFTRKAYERYINATDKGIVSDTEQEIVDIILEQEIVSYCTSAGCVSFDVNDIVEV